MSPHIEGARQVPRSTAPNQAAEADVGAKRPGTAIALILGTMVGFLAVVGLFWIGPLGSDDSLVLGSVVQLAEACPLCRRDPS